jgi:hypothetical protein
MIAKRIVGLIFIVAVALLVQVAATNAQPEVAEGTPPFATVIDNALWIYPTEGEPIQVDTGDAQSIPYLAWSPDGQNLAYVVYNQEYTPELYVYNVEQGTSTKIDERLEAGFPVSFTMDGSRILYAKFSEESDPENGIYRADVITVSLTGEGETQGTFTLGVGCGGGSNIPADWVYGSETQGFGGFSLVLEDTPFGILHSSECGGSVTSLLQNGEDRVISQNFGRVKLSPDRTKAAGIELNVRMEGEEVIRESRLLISDLETLEITELPITNEPEQLAWSADGSTVYYSAKDATGDLYRDLEPDGRTALDTALGFSYGEIPSYTSSIWSVNIASGAESEVFRGDAYAIGRMVGIGDALYFSQIPNLDRWIDAIIAGEVRFDSMMDDQTQFVQPILSRLLNGEVEEVGANLGQFTPILNND